MAVIIDFTQDPNDFTSEGGVAACWFKCESVSLLGIYGMNVSVNTQCRFLGTPSEQGIMRLDNKVPVPTTATFVGFVKPLTFSKLASARKTIFKNEVDRGTLYTKNAVYENMMIESMQELCSHERFDCIEVRINLKDYLEENAAQS